MSSVPHEWLCTQIVDGTGDAVIFADRDGIIRLWNSGAERIFGYTAAEAIGASLDIIIPENLRRRHWDGYHRSMATGHTRYGAGDMLAVPALHKDGHRLSIEFSIAMVRQGDEVVGVGAIMRDVTMRWHQERELRARLAKLEAATSSAERGEA
jgi:PAS domain S-box-containing protein